MHNFKKLNVIKVMAPKAKGRPRTKPATDNLKDQDNGKIDQSTDKAKETTKQDLAGKEEVSEFPNISTEVLGDDKDAEIKELKAQLEKATQSSKVVEVKTNAPKEVKVRPSQSRKQTHTVYVAKKRGDEWGEVQTREMSEPAYNAIAKDMSLKVTLPKNSRLVEPEIKGCKDC